jgi:uncharacterized protein
MGKSRSAPLRRKKADTDLMFQRADEHWESGNTKSAFRLFLACAKAGDPSCQLNLGNFYSEGIGVRPNRELALYWYRRAYRQGHRSAASNIGLIYRDEDRLNQALAWFERAVKLRDGDANLEIAKIYLQRNDRTKAIRYLKQIGRAKSEDVTEASREEAAKLLARLTK